MNLIAFNTSQTLLSKFHQLNTGWEWDDILSLLSYNFQVKNRIWVRWNMQQIHLLKSAQMGVVRMENVIEEVLVEIP